MSLPQKIITTGQVVLSGVSEEEQLFQKVVECEPDYENCHNDLVLLVSEVEDDRCS